MSKKNKRHSRRSFLKNGGGTLLAFLFGAKASAKAQDIEFDFGDQRKPDNTAEDVFRLQLALLMDVSHSMNADEYRIQAEDTANALLSDDVKPAILAKLPVVIGVFQFSDDAKQIGNWHEIRSEQDLIDLSIQIRTMKRNIEASGTNIAKAISITTDHINKSGYKTYRKIIDISGDGRDDNIYRRKPSGSQNTNPAFDDDMTNSHGGGATGIKPITGDEYKSYFYTPESHRSVYLARDKAIKSEIHINGLAITVEPDGNVAEYYRNNVVTPGGFVIEAKGMGDFSKAIRKKLILEIAQADIEKAPKFEHG